MSDNINPQITDSVTQANVKSIAEQPAMLNNLMNQSVIDVSAMAAQNAVGAQQQANALNQITTPATPNTNATVAELEKAKAELDAIVKKLSENK